MYSLATEEAVEMIQRAATMFGRYYREERYDPDPSRDKKTGRFTFKNGIDFSEDSDIIKIKGSELENGLPIKGKPHSVVDKTDENGKTVQRRKYGADGMAVVDYDTTNHGKPKTHPTGAHKHEFDYSKKKPHGKPLPLTEEELNENSDIIKRGENYHD